MYRAMMIERSHHIGNGIDKLIEKKEKPMKTENGTITEYTLEERHAMLDESRNEMIKAAKKEEFISKKRAHLIPLRKTMSESDFEAYSTEWCRANRPGDKMTRLQNWIKAEEEAGATEYEIMCALTNGGGMSIPEWIGYSVMDSESMMIFDYYSERDTERLSANK